MVYSTGSDQRIFRIVCYNACIFCIFPNAWTEKINTYMHVDLGLSSTKQASLKPRIGEWLTYCYQRVLLQNLTGK